MTVADCILVGLVLLWFILVILYPSIDSGYRIVWDEHHLCSYGSGLEHLNKEQLDHILGKIDDRS